MKPSGKDPSPTEKGTEPAQEGDTQQDEEGPTPEVPTSGNSRASLQQAMGSFQAMGIFRLSSDREPACREGHEDSEGEATRQDED